MHPSASHTHAAVILAACLALASPSVATAQDKVEAAEQRARWQQVFNEALSQGSKLRRNNQASQAVQVYLNALGNLPAHVDNQDFRQSLARQLGQTYEDMNAVDAAVGVYRQIEELRPLGTITLQRAGRLDEALAYGAFVKDFLGVGRIHESKADQLRDLATDPVSGAVQFPLAVVKYVLAIQAYTQAMATATANSGNVTTITALIAGINLKYAEMARLLLDNVRAAKHYADAYTWYSRLPADPRGSEHPGLDGTVEALYGLVEQLGVEADRPRYMEHVTRMGVDAIQKLGGLHARTSQVQLQRARTTAGQSRLKVPAVTDPGNPDRARELQERLRARMTHVRDSQDEVLAEAESQLLEGMSRECARLGRASYLLGDLARAAKAYVKAEQLLEKYLKTVDQSRWTKLNLGDFQRRFAELRAKRVKVLNEAVQAGLNPADAITTPNANADDILDRLLSSPGG